MASADEYAAWIVKNADKRGTPEFDTVAAAYKDAMGGGGRAGRVKAQQDADRKTYDPTAGQSFGENVLQGIGSGMTSALRAVGGGRIANAMGLPATKEEAQQLDAPLMNTAGGQVGQAVGMAAPAALAIPFTPATIGGAAAAGAITGGALTEGGLGDRATGAAFGGAGGAIAGALPAVYQAGRGLVRGIVEPLTDAGRQRIAGRAIERFSTNPSSLEQLTNAPTATGARLTLAEATRDPGLMTLQRAVGTMDPEAAAMFGARQEANNAARLDALRTLTGESTQPASRVGRLNRIATGQPTVDEAIANRGQAAARSYGEAFDAGVDPGMAEAMAPQIAELMQRPSVQAGMAQARRLAAEEGINLGDGGSVQGLHYLKQALDDQTRRLVDQPTRQRLVAQTAQDLGSVLEEIAPAYQTARREFQNNSIPVNRAQIGQRLLDSTTGALRDFGGNQRLQANAFAKALNDEQRLVAQSTGFRANRATLDDILTPTQSGRVNATRDELETLANLNSAANGPGSQTAKMLASQNMLRQVAGPLGIPESWMESVLSQTALRPIQFGYKSAEPRIGAAITEGMLDPARASQLVQLARARDAVRPPTALQRLLGRTAPALIGAEAAQ